MGIATLEALRESYEPTLFLPPGLMVAEARRIGIPVEVFTSRIDLFRRLRPFFASNRQLKFVTTSVIQSFLGILLTRLYRRSVVHLHVVHGGNAEFASYGRKRLLTHLPVGVVTVSEFARERLIAHGVPTNRIAVIENFLQPSWAAAAPRRPPFVEGVRRLLVISRLERFKHVDLLIDALESDPALARLPVRIVGAGSQLEPLRARAAAAGLDVTFTGFTPDVAGELAATDLLVHLCHIETFGLTVLEALAVGVPALVPDEGGTARVVVDGVSGFHFRATDAVSLAGRLRYILTLPPGRLNEVVQAGYDALAARFSAKDRAADYRRLLETDSGARSRVPA